MKYTVISTEDGMVRLEDSDGILSDLPITDLPCEIHEGCILTKLNNNFVIDNDATAFSKNKVFGKLNRLFEKNKFK